MKFLLKDNEGMIFLESDKTVYYSGFVTVLAAKEALAKAMITDTASTDLITTRVRRVNWLFGLEWKAIETF